MNECENVNDTTEIRWCLRTLCSPSVARWPGTTGVVMCNGDGVDSCGAPFAAEPAQGVNRGNGILPMSRARGGGS